MTTTQAKGYKFSESPAPSDKRRITEDDPDFRRIHAAVERQLWAGIRAYVRALQSEPASQHAKAASVFIAHQLKALQAGYLAGHWEGERDYWHAFSAKHSVQAHSGLSQRHGVAPSVQRMRRALLFYGAGSITKMAREAQSAWAADQHAKIVTKIVTATPTTPAPKLAESITLDDAANKAMNAWLGGLTARVSLSADVSWTGLQDGYLAAGTIDPANPYSVVWWQLEPAAQHCFPAGTAITTPDGEKPVEAVRVGDLVTTLSGPRRVTRLFRSVYQGELARVQAADKEVRCTPNHPFLTQRGWVAAEALQSGDQVVLSQDGGDLLACHVRLPDADNGIAAGGQVGILGAVTTLLRKLARRQRLEARMTVPVVAVSLNNQRTDADVNDELVLDDRRRLVVNAKLGQDETQQVLQFAGLVALKSLVSCNKLHVLSRSFFRMRSPIRANFGARFCAMHRIVRDHVGLRGAVYEAISRLVSQSHMLLASARANGSNRQPQCRSNSDGSFVRVVFTHISETFRRPDVARRRSWRAWLAITTQGQATAAPADGVSAIAFVPTDRTPLHGFWARSMLLAETPIATRHTTESSRGRAAPVLLEDLSTLFASVLHRHSDTPPVLVTSIPQETTVYNLEVQEAHHYIANGFVVHNCNDCPSLASGSPYTAPGAGGNELPQTPGDGGTECGAGCKCTLQYGSPLIAPMAWTGQAAPPVTPTPPSVAPSGSAGYPANQNGMPPEFNDYLARRDRAIAEALRNRPGLAYPIPPADEWTRNYWKQITEATHGAEPWKSIADALTKSAEPLPTVNGSAPWQQIADALIEGAPISEEEAKQQMASPPLDGQLTEGQKGALDLYRKASLAWDQVRGSLPPLDLFTTGQDWQDVNFDTLTPEQRAAYASYIEALREWADSTPIDQMDE